MIENLWVNCLIDHLEKCFYILIDLSDIGIDVNSGFRRSIGSGVGRLIVTLLVISATGEFELGYDEQFGFDVGGEVFTRVIRSIGKYIKCGFNV